MELYLDTADSRFYTEMNNILPLAGVTTNPSIIAGAGRDVKRTLDDLIKELQPEQRLFVQVTADSAEGMVLEARQIRQLRAGGEGAENTYAKIPVTREGMTAIRQCKREGIGVLATAVFTADQGFLAAENGADYIAPYVNRMEDYTDAIREVQDLLSMLEKNALPAKVLAASFKNKHQVHQLIASGVHAVTVSPQVALAMLEHPGTQKAVEGFSAQWRARYGRDTLFTNTEEEKEL